MACCNVTRNRPFRGGTYFATRLTSPVGAGNGADDPEFTVEQQATSRRRIEKSIAKTRYWMGVPSAEIRFVSPAPMSLLVAEIRQVGRWFDRQTDTSARSAAAAFRRTCQPLGDFCVRSERRKKQHWGYIGLKWRGRMYCLLRYHEEFPSQSVDVDSGRSAGCQLVLLPEREANLQREIEFFKKKCKSANKRKKPAKTRKRVAASARGKSPSKPMNYEELIYFARRFSRRNPYPPPKKYRHPEDDPPMLAHFGPKRPADFRE